MKVLLEGRHTVLFIMLRKVIVMSVNGILVCDHSNENY